MLKKLCKETWIQTELPTSHCYILKGHIVNLCYISGSQVMNSSLLNAIPPLIFYFEHGCFLSYLLKLFQRAPLTTPIRILHTMNPKLTALNMDDWNLDDKSLGKWQELQHCRPIITPPIHPKLQGMTNNNGLTFSVGDTMQWLLTITIEQDN